jgi:hypothetical protein
MLGYLAYRPSDPGFLFLFQDGSTLSRPPPLSRAASALQIAGVTMVGYSGHSFWIATTAVQLGLSDSQIQVEFSSVSGVYSYRSRHSGERFSQACEWGTITVIVQY